MPVFFHHSCCGRLDWFLTIHAQIHESHEFKWVVLHMSDVKRICQIICLDRIVPTLFRWPSEKLEVRNCELLWRVEGREDTKWKASSEKGKVSWNTFAGWGKQSPWALLLWCQIWCSRLESGRCSTSLHRIQRCITIWVWQGMLPLCYTMLLYNVPLYSITC